MMPIEAETLKNSTSHTSQNCGVRCASDSATLKRLIDALALVGAVQPAGAHPSAGTR